MVERDGTSQAGRGQPALEPGYAAIDERSAQDLLEFAQAYAGELRYFNERDEPDGDWSGLLGREPEDLAGLAALVEGRAPAGARADRPHVALLLAFLRLLGQPRELVNSLTGRHLAFYYEQLLRLSRKSAVADRVHVLFRLAAGAERARLPAGTLLRAGKDSAGRDRIYQTDRELVVGRAKVARLSSVYVQKEVVGLREARERHKGTREEAVLRMLAIALGAPRPGDPLPRYGGKDVTYPLLLELAQRVGFAAASLYMGFSDLHSLMKLVRQRAADAGEWRAINAILERAGRERLHDPQWTLSPADPRDFAANLAKALGGPLDFARDGLAGVDSIEDLYEQRIRQDVKIFIRDRLYLSEADFIAMMQVKLRVDSEWREINRLLEQAGRRKRNNPAYRLDPRRPPTAFDANLQAAIGPIPFGALPAAILPPVTDLGSYYNAILAAESYFHLNAAQIGYVLTTAAKGAPAATAATDREWESVYRLLSEAHRDKVYAERRAALAAAVAAAASPIAGLRAVLRIALGTAAGEPDPALPDLRPYVAAPKDYAFLEPIPARLERGAISSDDWARVFEVVELAQRVRERLPAPAAQRETWLDLFPAADATQLAADPAAAPPRWRTFGQRPPEADPDRPPAAALGWALRSPMLLLGQGERTIVLTLGFLARGFDAAALGPLFAASLSGVALSPLELQISTEKGWRPVEARPAMGDYRALSKVSRAIPEPLRAIQLTLVLGEDAPAVAPGPPGATGLPGGAPWPALRILLRRVWSAERGQYVSRYEAFRDLVLATVHLQVKVEGLVPSAIQSEDAVLSAKKPFEPFGATPGVGARFLVGDPELVQKRLDRVTFHVEWRGGPADLAAHYANYPSPGPFTAQINLIDDRRSLPITAAPVPLFADNDATKRRDIELAGIPAALEKPGTGYRYEPAAAMPPAGPVTGWPRYLEWVLGPIDFKHHVYPALAAEKAVALTAALIEKPPGFSAANYQVRPPYTPKIQRLWVDYAAQLELVQPATAPGAGLHELFHVHPFGASPIGAEAAPGGARFLPEYEREGELYIGVQGARPPETLSLLVQVAEGSADPDLRPAPIEWSYLSGDRWRTLHDGHLLLDTTRGLIDSGIVQLALPPAEPSARLPGELYWIRAAIAERPDSVCDAVAIHAQAVSATLAERGNASDHYARGLPARSVAGLVQRVAQIAAVEQPYPSRGGRAPESDGAFFTRASERLRHKQRALTPWDYERLVLERFPELYKVKCIPADAARDPAPGAVRIVVIPDLRGRGVSDRFEPKASAALIAQIEAHLAEVRPPEARVTAQSARFVQVKVRVGVWFRGAGDEVFYRSLLQGDLSRFLSPWAYDERAELVIGGTISANGVVSFVDGLDYIDFVAAIELFTSEDGQVFRPVPTPASGSYQVTADGPDGVLVTARRHEIDVVPDARYTASTFTGINYMKIDLDFVVAGSATSTPSP